MGSKLKGLDKSTSLTRKALRLGKFLGNAKDLRALLHANTALTSAGIALQILPATLSSNFPCHVILHVSVVSRVNWNPLTWRAISGRP
jgi:hypothetical protein